MKIIIENTENRQQKFKYDLEEMEHSLSLIQNSVLQISQNINKLKNLEDLNTEEGVNLLEKIDSVARKMVGTYNRRHSGPIQNAFADIRGWVGQIKSSFKSDEYKEEARRNKAKNEPEIDF